MRWIVFILVFGCEGGPWIDESTDTMDEDPVEESIPPEWVRAIGLYEGTVRITLGGGWGEDTECSGPVRATIDANGVLFGTAECVAQRTVLSGAIYGATQKPTAAISGQWVLDFLNYTVPVSLAGYADGDQLSLTIAYEDDLGTLVGTIDGQSE